MSPYSQRDRKQRLEKTINRKALPSRDPLLPARLHFPKFPQPPRTAPLSNSRVSGGLYTQASQVLAEMVDVGQSTGVFVDRRGAPWKWADH